MRLRQLAGESKAQTIGLSDETIERFCEHDSKLVEAIDEASEAVFSILSSMNLELM